MTRIVVTEPQLQLDAEPTLRDVSEALVAFFGTDYGIHSPIWLSRFTDMTRQAAAYRDRRVLLAGDAAHVHPPVGGQGLNMGVQDAVNLGWKLAQVVEGTSPDSLLDTYHAERHPVAARVLRTTTAQVMLRSPGERAKALRDTLSDVLAMEEPSRRFAAMMSGLDIHYDLGPAGSGEAHPLVGRRMPDLDLATHDGPVRVFALLHEARPVLLDLGEPGGFDITPWPDRVRLVHATYEGTWDLPVTRDGRCSHRRADSARRPRGVGRGLDAARSGRRVGNLVRSLCCGVVVGAPFATITTCPSRCPQRPSPSLGSSGCPSASVKSGRAASSDFPSGPTIPQIRTDLCCGRPA